MTFLKINYDHAVKFWYMSSKNGDRHDDYNAGWISLCITGELLKLKETQPECVALGKETQNIALIKIHGSVSCSPRSQSTTSWVCWQEERKHDFHT